MTAYKFGISLDKVSIKPSYNVIAPNANVAAFSITSEAVAYASFLDLREKLIFLLMFF